MRWIPSSLMLALPLLVSQPAVAERPILLELFTSQGCSSCPSADKLLGDLAQQSGVLALAFHVDYWDRLGWKDPYASPEWTARQRRYGATLTGSRYAGQIYTPQMVIDGRADAVGSDAPAIGRAVAKARTAAIDLGVGLAQQDKALKVSAPPSAYADARLLLLVVDPPHMTRVTRGENAGQTLREARIVRAVEQLPTYNGAAFEVTIDDPRKEPGQTIALVLQRADGVVLGAATLD